MKTLLRLQELDLKIEACKARETEIPKQKGKYDIHRKRLADELAEREKRYKDLIVEQGGHETEIEQKQAQIAKYDAQLYGVKKNEEYQALLHEIDLCKKQIAQMEERILTIMEGLEDAKARLEEDKKRIAAELAEIDAECKTIDQELLEAVRRREELEGERAPIVDEIEHTLLAMYERIRKSKKGGAAVVPINGEYCTGCHMSITPQVINEILAGDKIHTCNHCGRLLYCGENIEGAEAQRA